MLQRIISSKYWKYTKYILAGLGVLLAILLSLFLFRKTGGAVYYSRRRRRLYDDYMKTVLAERIKQEAAKGKQKLAREKVKEIQKKLSDVSTKEKEDLSRIDEIMKIEDDEERRKKLIDAMKIVEGGGL